MPELPDSEPSTAQPLKLTFRGPTCLDAATLSAIRKRGADIHIVVDNELRFVGTDSELAALAFDRDGIAGEHPLEHVIRLLTVGAPATLRLGTPEGSGVRALRG